MPSLLVYRPKMAAPVLCFVVILFSAWTTCANVAFEAAFQGECREDGPCQQLCFDLHDGTFECGCSEGYALEGNGYSCIPNAKQVNQVDEPCLKEDASSPSNKKSPESAAKSDGRIIGATFVDGTKSRPPPRSASQTRGGDGDHRHHHRLSSTTTSEDDYDNRIDIILDPSSSGEGDHGPAYRADVVDEYSGSSGSGAAEVQFEMMNTVTVTTPVSGTRNQQQEEDEEPVDEGPEGPLFLACDEMTCFAGGTCVQDLRRGGVKCSCPLGTGGLFCDQAVEVRYPRFVGASFLALPVLKDAHTSMQVTLEFRPEAYNGILLYSGERADLQGDYFAILLVKGFVEFRFDCGMGEGILRSDQPVVRQSWNSLTIYRDRWDAWMQLNNGHQEHGQAKGLFSKITFKLNLYLGGSPNASQVVQRLEVHDGFMGCVRHLEINSRKYDFRSGTRGDAVDGKGVEECSGDVCNQIACHNGGQCVATSPDTGTCVCSLGYTGSSCEIPVDIVVPSFNGSSYLQYPGLGNAFLSFIEVAIVFKPLSVNGVIFYNGYKMDGTGDFISLTLVNGFVEFRFDCGTGPAVIRSAQPITLGEWHTVFFTRTARDGVLEVDQQVRVESISPGAFTQISLPLNLYLGGVPDLRDTARAADITSSFVGCVQKITINNKPLKLLEEALSGVNVDNCQHPCVEDPCFNSGECEPKLDFYSCHCKLGFTGPNCEEEVKELIAEPMLGGSSYLHYVSDGIMKRVRGNKIDIRMKFRSFSPHGLLLWAGEEDVKPSSDFIALGLDQGFVNLRYNLGSGDAFIVYNSTRVDDGSWHTINVVRYQQEGSLTVDNGPFVTGRSAGSLNQLNVNSGLFIGGMKDIVHYTRNKYQSGLVGCVGTFTLSTDYHVRLVTQAATGINVQPCI